MPPKLDLTSRCETEQLVGALKQGFKVGNFGLARAFGSPERANGREYTRRCLPDGTKAPELLLGLRGTGQNEFVGSWNGIRGADARKPFCPGSSDIDQLTKIYHGDADRGGVGRVLALPDWMNFP